jgi:FMN phosphatase YigB (HAD superfamily)
MNDYAVWSDFRGVLTPPLSVGLDKFCEGEAFTPEHLMVCLGSIALRYGAPDGMAVLDTGTLDERQWTREIEHGLRDEFGIEADLSDFGSRWWSDRRVDPVWVDAVRTWRAEGAFVGLVSNLPVDWKAGFAAFADFDDLFDAVVLSCDVGARKPDAALFAYAESVSGRLPRFNILADDLAANVAGARLAGWTAVVAGGEATAQAVADIGALLTSQAVQGGTQ